MQGSLEQLKQYHFLFMKWMNKTDAPLATVANRIGFSFYGHGWVHLIFRTKVSEEGPSLLSSFKLMQQDIINVSRFCSMDYGNICSYLYTTILFINEMKRK